eukprot:CAMPEP_0178385432 /NCGR_PEP_ID=MMETSP0689_2-20121128/8029_1 /TAXON_ID=160604 /ORGANISM="Amphidinium massartii, Strain CS-259" /LENGTH=315 /DNA_ID=CAMNT_0020005713 /DNA_START=19 /DNA_END=963 /DNA_ORIENTATION=+
MAASMRVEPIASGGAAASNAAIDPLALHMVRITLLGSGGAGKTSLVSAFVNNHCPSVHTETHETTLYYRTMQVLPGKQQSRKEEVADSTWHRGVASMGSSSMPFNALVEVEDTFPSDRKTARAEENTKPGPLRVARSMSVERPIDKFLDVRKNPLAVNSPELFQGVAAPKAHSFDAVGHARMGFIVVFDASDNLEKTSFHQAVEIIDSLVRSEVRNQAVIVLVANKCDKKELHPLPPDQPSACALAKVYAEEKKLRYAEICAMDLKAVRGLFRSVVSEIREAGLWRISDASRDVSRSRSKNEMGATRTGSKMAAA